VFSRPAVAFVEWLADEKATPDQSHRRKDGEAA
jgi:hypothetical protein